MAVRTENASKDTDRRFFERLPQHSVLRVLDPKEPRTDQFAILKDISRSGVRLEVGNTFPAGTIVTLYLPKTQFGPPRRMNARIMWCNLSNETVGWYQVGARFTK